MQGMLMLFFDFIEVELDSENPKHKVAANVLTVLQNFYEYKTKLHLTNSSNESSPSKTLFVQFKDLIEQSKKLQKKIKLTVAPQNHDALNGGWDPTTKEMVLEETEQVVNFVTNIISNLCRSINPCYADQAGLTGIVIQSTSQ